MKFEGDQCLGWLLTVVLWVLLLKSYFGLSDSTPESRDRWYIATGIVGLLYLVAEFYSPNFRAMMNQKQAADAYEFMERVFRERPQWDLHVECYHNTTVIERSTNSQGRTKTRRHSKRVVTHTAHEPVAFRSWRDVSGHFILNSGEAMANVEIPYVRLSLKLEFEWAADGSEGDFTAQSTRFKDYNRRDVHQDYSETKTLQDWTSHSLVRVSDYQPCCYSSVWYILFVLLTLAEVYKLHINKYMAVQEFTVRKLLSTRVDLNSPEFEPKYQVSGIIAAGRQIDFQPNPNTAPGPDIPVGQPIAPSAQTELQDLISKPQS
jgi:hypothetical protein